jgi:hypothetical protein
VKRNGRPRHRRLEYDQELGLEKELRRAPVPDRMGLFAWLRCWRLRPGRVFWEFDPARGEWRRL